MNPNQDGERALLSAILDQAFSDAVSIRKNKDINPREARSFIDHNNPYFKYYCDLLDIDAEYVARKMQERLRKHDLRPLKQFRD